MTKDQRKGEKENEDERERERERYSLYNEDILNKYGASRMTNYTSQVQRIKYPFASQYLLSSKETQRGRGGGERKCEK